MDEAEAMFKAERETKKVKAVKALAEEHATAGYSCCLSISTQN